MIYPLFKSPSRKSSMLSEAALSSRRVMEKRFKEQAVAVEGTIVGIDNEVRQLKNGERLTFEYPRVRFTTVSGDTIEVRSPHGYTPCRSNIGELVTVFYRTNNPLDARVEVRPLS